MGKATSTAPNPVASVPYYKSQSKTVYWNPEHRIVHIVGICNCVKACCRRICGLIQINPTIVCFSSTYPLSFSHISTLFFSPALNGLYTNRYKTHKPSVGPEELFGYSVTASTIGAFNISTGACICTCRKTRFLQ